MTRDIIRALGVLCYRGQTTCYYLGPRYVHKTKSMLISSPYKTPQPPSVLFYYVGTLFQQPAKVINHCHAAPATPAMIHISIFLMDFFYIRRTVCIKLWLFAIHRMMIFNLHNSHIAVLTVLSSVIQIKKNCPHFQQKKSPFPTLRQKTRRSNTLL